MKIQNEKLEIEKECIKTVERIENKVNKELLKLNKIMCKKVTKHEKEIILKDAEMQKARHTLDIEKQESKTKDRLLKRYGSEKKIYKKNDEEI